MEEGAPQDLQLVESALRGDGDAFAEIVRRHQRLVAGIAWRYGVPRQEIEDLVSAVFLKVYANLQRYRPDHAFSTWLYRLATNHVLDHGRRARHRRQQQHGELPESLADPRPGPAGEAEAHERSRLVQQALAELPAHYRETLFLVYVEGLRVDEAAETLGVPEGTVKSRLLRGRLALRTILERRHPGAFGGG